MKIIMITTTTIIVIIVPQTRLACRGSHCELRNGFAASAPPGSPAGAPDYSAGAPPGSPNDLFFSDPLLAFSLLLDLLSLVWGAAAIIIIIIIIISIIAINFR